MSKIIGTTIVYNSIGVPTEGISVKCRMVEPPPEEGVFDDSERTFTSVSGGVVNFTDLFTGATYLFWRGRSDRMRHRIPEDAESPYSLPPILGNDSSDTCIIP